MGTLIYGRTQEYDFDDRTLAHLQVVIVSRMRRNESFFLTWASEDPRRPGAARAPISISIWIAPSISIAFRFSGDRREPLSREWLRRLTASSYSARGLVLAPDAAVEARDRRAARPR